MIAEKKKYAFEAGKSIWVHKAPVSQGIYRFKYKNRRCYGEIFAAEMAAELGDAVKQWKIEEIIPVPLHRSRQRIRGYNQAQILAEEHWEKAGSSREQRCSKKNSENATSESAWEQRQDSKSKRSIWCHKILDSEKMCAGHR
mgnify:CR=1 FL=1